MGSRFRPFLLLLTIFVGLAGFARAESHVRIVRLSYINGQVQVDRGQGAGYEQALPNMPIVEGLKIATAADGVAELEFEDGSTLRITPETEIEIRQLALEDSGATLSTVALLQGTAYIDFRKHKEDVFDLVLPERQLTLSHAVRLRVEVAQDEAELAVFNGELDVTDADQVLRVKKNQSLTFEFADASKYTLAKEIEPAPYDDWSNEREKYRERYASTIDRASSMPAYGLADLAYYGSSFDLPGYGWVWQPYGVSYGWNPFYSGYWNYYPATGWMWCSYAPWGWYPYRYGSWFFAPGRGWVWSPGSVVGVTSWHPVPPVLGAPSGFRPPLRPVRPPTSPANTIIAVGEKPVWGPGRRPYDPTDPVLIVHRDGWRKGKDHDGPTRSAAPATASGGVSTFTPPTAGPTALGSSPDQHRVLRPGGVPASVHDLRHDINTPENQSSLGVMRRDDSYDRHLHREIERTAPAYSIPPTGSPQPAAAAQAGWRHEQQSHQSAGAQPAPSHASGASAQSHAGSGGGFSGGGAPHSSGGGASMNSGGGGASHSSGGSGGGAAHGGGGRPPR